MKILEEIHQYIILSKYIFDKDDIITDTAIHLEREFNQNLLIIDLEKDLVKIQFNLNENYFYEKVKEIFICFFQGDYIIKNYCHNEKLLYSKLIWKDKELKEYNFKTKYSFHFCKKNNNIKIVEGVKWG